MNTEQDEEQGLKIDKKVSIAFIAAVFVQTFLVGWWAATAAGELAVLKDKVEAQTANRFTRVEAELLIANGDRRMDLLTEIMIKHSARLRDVELSIKDLEIYKDASGK